MYRVADYDRIRIRNIRVNRNQKLRESDYGKYTEIKNEKDLIAATAFVSLSFKRVIYH